MTSVSAMAFSSTQRAVSPTLHATWLLLGIGAFATLQGLRVSAGDASDQLQYIGQHAWLFKLENIVGALMTLPSAVLIGWIAAERRLAGQRSVALALGLSGLLGYVILVNVAYASQYVLADAWFFGDEPLGASSTGLLYLDAMGSLPGLLKLLGYTFCSVASVAVGHPGKTPATISKWVTALLFASGVFGLLGWLECTALSVTTGWGLTLSGLLVVPYCVAILITERSMVP